MATHSKDYISQPPMGHAAASRDSPFIKCWCLLLVILHESLPSEMWSRR